MQPDATRIANVAATAVDGAEVEQTSLGVVVRVPLSAAATLLRALKDETFGFMVDLFAVDTGEGLEITYHLRSLGRDEEIYVRAPIEYDATLPSVWEIFPAAAFPEREAAELFGMRLSGHPNPTRLLTSPGSPPFLRKDQSVRTAEEVRLR